VSPPDQLEPTSELITIEGILGHDISSTRHRADDMVISTGRPSPWRKRAHGSVDRCVCHSDVAADRKSVRSYSRGTRRAAAGRAVPPCGRPRTPTEHTEVPPYAALVGDVPAGVPEQKLVVLRPVLRGHEIR